VIVFDTTVLVYAKGEAHPLRDPCRRLVAAVADGELEASTTAEVIQEFVYVRARRRGRHDAASLGNDYADLLSPLLTVTRDDLRQGLSLFERASALGAFDAVLAATAAAAGAACLVSADGAFAAIADVRHLVPDDVGVSALLGA
jgi:predicted nucleic acid-binding protein